MVILEEQNWLRSCGTRGLLFEVYFWRVYPRLFGPVSNPNPFIGFGGMDFPRNSYVFVLEEPKL